MHEEHIIFSLLMDFLRYLPEDFDRNTSSYSQCIRIVRDFMDFIGLSDEEKKEI